MSDRQLGDDWWLASDGKWYPPQSRPAAPAPPPPSAGVAASPGQYYQADVGGNLRRYVPFGLTGTLAGFVMAASAASAVSAALFLVAWMTWMNDGSTFADVVRAWDSAADASGIYALFFFIAFILLLVWLNNAYKAGQSRGATARRWGSGWTVGGWFIPFANLVIPKLVVNEVDRMSRAELSEPIGTTWTAMPRLVYSDLWWALYLIGIASTMVASSGTDSSLDYLALYAFGHACIAAAGGFMAATVLTIGKRLRSEPASPFGTTVP